MTHRQWHHWGQFRPVRAIRSKRRVLVQVLRPNLCVSTAEPSLKQGKNVVEHKIVHRRSTEPEIWDSTQLNNRFNRAFTGVFHALPDGRTNDLLCCTRRWTVRPRPELRRETSPGEEPKGLQTPVAQSLYPFRSSVRQNLSVVVVLLFLFRTSALFFISHL